VERKALFKKYLSLLEVEKAEPSLALLKKIVKAHLIKVPFENISKLYYKQQGKNYFPELPQYLDDIDMHNFGGTCYANNYYLYLLLEHLGFDIKLCGADMRQPDVHVISMVDINRREFVVDCGYAAPFLSPLPADLNEDYCINFGNEKYIIRPRDESGRIKVEQYSDDKLQHWYAANTQPREIDDFSKVIADSYSNDAVFMNAIRITKFSESGSFVLKNLLYTETAGSESATKKLSRDELPDFVSEKFDMPANLVREAVAFVKELKDIYD